MSGTKKCVKMANSDFRKLLISLQYKRNKISRGQQLLETTLLCIVWHNLDPSNGRVTQTVARWRHHALYDVWNSDAFSCVFFINKTIFDNDSSAQMKVHNVCLPHSKNQNEWNHYTGLIKFQTLPGRANFALTLTKRSITLPIFYVNPTKLYMKTLCGMC